MTIGTGATATSDSRWSERNIRDDLDGNLLHLERYQDNANTPQATLDFSYDGPKRNGYSYDSNGNITYDPLRCFEIRYNLLNLAAEVIGHDPEESADSTSASADDGAATANETSDGVLLSETVYYADGTRSGVRRPNDGPWLTRYVSSLICDGDSEFLYPMGVVSDFGYIDLQSGKMQYFLRDHLGSVRVIAEDRHTVISRTDYLPFGVRMSGDGLTAGNPTARSSFFGFSGKENEMWGGYDTADGDITPHWLKGERYQHFGARAYDPVSCIFMQVDPMAEKYYGMSPYAYCHNNSINRFDFEGKWDIRVSAFSDRAKCPYAILTAYSRTGQAFYSTVVRVTASSRNRLLENLGDTPTGTYQILEWRNTGNSRYTVESYGINPLLALKYVSGEAFNAGRQNMHLHGGRPKSGSLAATNGCIRMCDADIAELKELTDWIEANDSYESKGLLIVEDILDSEIYYSEREDIKNSILYDCGEIEPALVYAGFRHFSLDMNLKYLDTQFNIRHYNEEDL